MSEICPKCGLPRDICVCDAIAREQQAITVFTVKRRYGKQITIVDGLSKDVDLKQICKKLKLKLACGGTVKEMTIELQGSHTAKVKEELIKMGFSPETIIVK